MTVEERLSRELDEAIEQEHIAQFAYSTACRNTRVAKRALQEVTGKVIHIYPGVRGAVDALREHGIIQ